MIKDNTSITVLNLPITELAVSEEFKNITIKYGYFTLSDFLKLEKTYDVLQHDGFGYRMLAELTHLFFSMGLIDYLN